MLLRTDGPVGEGPVGSRLEMLAVKLDRPCLSRDRCARSASTPEVAPALIEHLLGGGLWLLEHAGMDVVAGRYAGGQFSQALGAVTPARQSAEHQAFIMMPGQG
ncbi:hypothetical protein D3C73_902250 [compost metagenome]